MAAFLKAHRTTPTSRQSNCSSICGPRRRAAPARSRPAPAGRSCWLSPSTLQVLVEQIRELEAEIAEALDAHPDGEIFRSFFQARRGDLRRDAAGRDR